VFVDVKADTRASYALERKRLNKRYTKSTIELMENASHELLLLLAKDELVTAVQGDYEANNVSSSAVSSSSASSSSSAASSSASSASSSTPASSASSPSASSATEAAAAKPNLVHTKWRLIATLLGQLPQADRARLLLQQVILSHMLPTGRVARGKVLAIVFSVTAKVVTEGEEAHQQPSSPTDKHSDSVPSSATGE
jgi:hypothetical protein